MKGGNERYGPVASSGVAMGAAAYEEALMHKRIEALQRLKEQFIDPGSVASQAVAAYSDLLDGNSYPHHLKDHIEIESTDWYAPTLMAEYSVYGTVLVQRNLMGTDSAVNALQWKITGFTVFSYNQREIARR